MTRIGGPGGPKRPTGPKGPGRAEGPDETKRTDFVRGLSGPEGPHGVDADFSVTDATYGRMASRIKDALARGLDQDQVLGHVIEGEIEAHFGKQASPEMAKSVADAFHDNSQLQSLFHQVLARVRGDGAPGR